MPIYEYQCEACAAVFEYMQTMSEARKTVCERCSGPLKRLISPVAFQFKGGGWYKDLYSSAKPEAKGDGAHGSAAGGDGGGSSAGGKGDAAGKGSEAKPTGGAGDTGRAAAASGNGKV